MDRSQEYTALANAENQTDVFPAFRLTCAS